MTKNEEVTTLAKFGINKTKEEEKDGGNGKGKKGKNKETHTCNFCGIKGHIED
jgi:hypothetical protein